MFKYLHASCFRYKHLNKYITPGVLGLSQSEGGLCIAALCHRDSVTVGYLQRAAPSRTIHVNQVYINCIVNKVCCNLLLSLPARTIKTTISRDGLFAVQALDFCQLKI